MYKCALWSIKHNLVKILVVKFFKGLDCDERGCQLIVNFGHVVTSFQMKTVEIIDRRLLIRTDSYLNYQTLCIIISHLNWKKDQIKIGPYHNSTTWKDNLEIPENHTTENL